MSAKRLRAAISGLSGQRHGRWCRVRAPSRALQYGGHKVPVKESTCHDMNVGLAAMHEYGIMVVDDVGCCTFDSSWSFGVITGIQSSFKSPVHSDVEPFLYLHPKLYLARRKAAARYRTAILGDPNMERLFRFNASRAEGQSGKVMHSSRYTLFGGQVLAIGVHGNMYHSVPSMSAVRQLWTDMLARKK